MEDVTKKLSPEDQELLLQGLKILRQALVFGKWVKWLIIFVAGVIIGGAQLWDAIKHLWGKA